MNTDRIYDGIYEYWLNSTFICPLCNKEVDSLDNDCLECNNILE